MKNFIKIQTYLKCLLLMLFVACSNETEKSKRIQTLTSPSNINLPQLKNAYPAYKKTFVGDFIPMLGKNAQPGIIVTIGKNNQLFYLGKTISPEVLEVNLQNHAHKYGNLIPVFIWIDINNNGQNLKSILSVITKCSLHDIRLGVSLEQKENNIPGFVFFRSYKKGPISKEYPYKIPTIEILNNKLKFDGKEIPPSNLKIPLASVNGETAQLVRNIGVFKKIKSLIFDFHDDVNIQKIVEILSICNKTGVECCYLTTTNTKSKNQSNELSPESSPNNQHNQLSSPLPKKKNKDSWDEWE